LIDMPDDQFFSRSEHLFLHGVTGGVGGTCSSLPVAYVAVGRRLGYPLRLVKGVRHLFARWDDPHGERFNIECTSRGFVSHPDEHYRCWPFEASDEAVQKFGLLRSLSEEEENASFLCTRGQCLERNARTCEATWAYARAANQAPEDLSYLSDLE